MYGPVKIIETPDGGKQYTKTQDGITFYYLDAACTILHNERGAAIDWETGPKHYYLSNKHYYKAEYDKIMAEKK